MSIANDHVEPATNTLAKRLKQQIHHTGPMRVSDYWACCLFDPADGYYTTREPFGTNGDFTTAPEISQMFGEMLAVWWLETVRLNTLESIALVEIGPGRGTLMADILRTLAKLDKNSPQIFAVHMVETSKRLSEIQQKTLQSSAFSITWHETIDTVPRQSIGIIANELFDAVPIRQFVKTNDGWQELCVGLDEQDAFCFVAGSGGVDQALLPQTADIQKIGTIFEISPAREALMHQVSQRLNEDGSFGLFIDYGHDKSRFGNTLQSLKKHQFINVLQDQGLVDITSHVDFEALSRIAAQQELQTYPTKPQGTFLSDLGIQSRCEQLCSGNPEDRNTLVTACERLVSTQQMGSLFRVLAVSRRGIQLPAF